MTHYSSSFSILTLLGLWALFRARPYISIPLSLFWVGCRVLRILHLTFLDLLSDLIQYILQWFLEKNAWGWVAFWDSTYLQGCTLMQNWLRMDFWVGIQLPHNVECIIFCLLVSCDVVGKSSVIFTFWSMIYSLSHLFCLS